MTFSSVFEIIVRTNAYQKVLKNRISHLHTSYCQVCKRIKGAIYNQCYLLQEWKDMRVNVSLYKYFYFSSSLNFLHLHSFLSIITEYIKPPVLTSFLCCIFTIFNETSKKWAKIHTYLNFVLLCMATFWKVICV